MIETRGLTKTFGPVQALSGVSLEVRQGEIFGLLGPNGSGKTTTIRLLLGLLRPTAGSASVAGLDCWRQSLEVRRLVSYLPGELRLPGAMTGLGLLRFLGDLRGGVGLERSVAIAERLMRLDLRRKVRGYSTGMKQKLALAQVFSEPVDLLILDEPTSALDPTARAEVLDLVLQARAGGQTVIFSGHVLSEVERVADRVAIMRRGRLMHIENMRDRSAKYRLVLAKFPGEPPGHTPEELGLVIRERQGDTLLMEHHGDAAPLLGWLAEVQVLDVAIGLEDLESVYNQYHGPLAKNVEDEFA